MTLAVKRIKTIGAGVDEKLIEEEMLDVYCRRDGVKQQFVGDIARVGAGDAMEE